MRAWKYLLLLVGFFGALAVLAPMLRIQQGPMSFEISAHQLSFGEDRPQEFVEHELDKRTGKYIDRALGRSHTYREARLALKASRYAAVAYAPPALLALLGLLGILRRRFGRFLGFLALVGGSASIATWIAMRYGVHYALARPELKHAHTQLELMFGAHALLACGIVGALVGLGALIAPDDPRAR